MFLYTIRLFYKAGFFYTPPRFVALETFASLREKFISLKPQSKTSNKDLVIG